MRVHHVDLWARDAADRHERWSSRPAKMVAVNRQFRADRSARWVQRLDPRRSVRHGGAICGPSVLAAEPHVHRQVGTRARWSHATGEATPTALIMKFQKLTTHRADPDFEQRCVHTKVGAGDLDLAAAAWDFGGLRCERPCPQTRDCALSDALFCLGFT